MSSSLLVVDGQTNGYHSQLTTSASTPEVTEDAMEQVRFIANSALAYIRGLRANVGSAST